MSKPNFTKKPFTLSKDFKVRISQIPAMDVAFETMAMSEYELLVATIYKLNELIGMTNSYTELIDEILKWVVGDGLEQTTKNILVEWMNDGTLEVIINDALFNQKLDKDVFNDFVNNTYESFVDTTNQEIQNINGEISRIDDELEDLDEDIQEVTTQLAQTIQLITPNMTREEIQNMLDNSGDFKFTKGEYLVDLPNTYENEVFKLKSNTRVTFDADAIVRLSEHNALRYQLFSLDNIENIVLENLNLDGSRNSNIATSGEWGMGISIKGSKNVVVNNVKIKNCWGDGLYIGRTVANSFSENISINDLVCDNNRRQGVSVISVKGLYGKNLKLINTNGTSPEAGIDFEPNNEDEVLEDIVIDKLTTYNNNGSGLVIAPRFLGEVKKKIDITINNLSSENDQRGIYLLRFNGLSDGKVLFRNPIIRKSRSGAIGIRSISKNFSKIIIDSPTIVDSNFMGQGGTIEGSGISIFRGANDYPEDDTFRMGNIHIINPKFIKDEIDNFMYIGLTNYLNESDYIFDDIIIKELDGGENYPHVSESTLSGVNRLNATNSLTIKNEKPFDYFGGVSPVVYVWGNKIATYSKIDINADKNVDIQLPKVASEHCMDLEVMVTSTGNYKQRILPPEGESIYPTTLLTDGVLETTFIGNQNEGSRVTLRRRNSKWFVIDKIGAW